MITSVSIKTPGFCFAYSNTIGTELNEPKTLEPPIKSEVFNTFVTNELTHEARIEAKRLERVWSRITSTMFSKKKGGEVNLPVVNNCFEDGGNAFHGVFLQRLTRFVLIFLIILSPLLVFSQSIADLEKQRAKTERDLNATSELLAKTSKQRQQTMQHVNVLQRQLTLRKKLIDDIEKQIQLYEKEIDKKNLLISSYKNDLTNLKKEYAKLIRFAQRSKTDMDLLVFIFSSNHFNQAYRRLRFYKQFLNFREKQAKEIIRTQTSIEQEVQSVSDARNKLAKSKEDKAGEIVNLNSEKRRYSQSIKQLQQKEHQLRQEVEKRRKAMAALDKAIEDLIAEEARLAAKEKKSTIRDARYLRLSAGFEGNKGRLPWPSSNGVIVSDFGEHNHPVLKGVRIRNNGIDISTDPGAVVKSIYEGEVKKIVSIPGQNLAVIVRHGDFLTVYSNLETVSVKVGDNVTALQSLGQVYLGTKEKQSVFNLQIWQESNIQNPTHWILP